MKKEGKERMSQAKKFAELKCIACKGGIPLTLAKVNQYLSQLEGWSWEQNGVDQIIKHYRFKNFAEAIAFINKVAEIAEQEGHHPDITLYSYRNVKIALYTHAINGLHENDFIVAAKVDAMVKEKQ